MLDPDADYESAPCPACPKEMLDMYLHTGLGRYLMSIMDLDFALHHGFSISLDEISYRDFLILKIVIAERFRWEREQQEAEMEKQKRAHGR